MPFQEEQELLQPSTLDEDFLEPLSLVSFLIFVLSESSEEEKSFFHLEKRKKIYTHRYIYTQVRTYIHIHIHIHTYILGALTQLTLKNTSNRLTEEDGKLNV